MPATLPTLTDATAWTDADLDALRVAVLTEQERRAILVSAPAATEQIADRYAAAIGRQDGAAWVQPQGAHDAYPRGAVVAHGGKVWESTRPANVWTPGGPGVPAGLWKDVTATAPAPAPTPTAATWNGNAKAYKAGDLVAYKGTVYKVIGAHTSLSTWTPDVAHSLFVKV